MPGPPKGAKDTRKLTANERRAIATKAGNASAKALTWAERSARGKKAAATRWKAATADGGVNGPVLLLQGGDDH